MLLLLGGRKTGAERLICQTVAQVDAQRGQLKFVFKFYYLGAAESHASVLRARAQNFKKLRSPPPRRTQHDTSESR